MNLSTFTRNQSAAAKVIVYTLKYLKSIIDEVPAPPLPWRGAKN